LTKSKIMRFNIPLDEIIKKKPLVIDLASGSKADRKKALGIFFVWRT